ncbi:MAG: sulfatase-like hydrolase/transferase [Gemmatimonadales bacterium]
MRPAVRDLLTGIALVNLCFIAVWDEVLAVTRNRYLLDVSSADVVAVILNVIVVGAVCGAGAILARRHPSPWAWRIARAAFLAVLLLPLGRLAKEFNPLYAETLFFRVVGPAPRRLPLKELAPLLPLLTFATWPVASARIAQRVLLFLFPFALVTCGRGLWVLATGDLTTRYADQPPATARPSPGAGSPRLAIILLDQLGQRIAFTERPADLALPELDRLRGEAVFATHAIRAGVKTVISVPAMLGGHAVDSARHREPDELMVTFSGAPGPVAWSTAPTLFSWARAHGVNAGVAGWYHPYCRVFGALLTRCAWRPHADAIHRDRATLAARMGAQLRSLWPWDPRRRHIEDYRIVMAHAKAVLTDSSLGLAFVHLNVPHTPIVYDRRAGRFAVHNSRPAGYLDNVALADRALGELRRSMEAAGVWDRTTLIVVSDHPLGAPRDGRLVPFLVRLPGGHGATSDTPFHTVRLAVLGQEVLAGRLRTTADVVRWMEAR